MRVQLKGTNNYLSLAEVQVYGTAITRWHTNLALTGIETQASLAYGGVPERAADGNTDGSWYSGSVTHTDRQAEAWWQVDLRGPADISTISLWNRTDCCSDRLNNFVVFVSNSPFPSNATVASLLADASVWSYEHNGLLSGPSIDIPAPILGRYVRVQLKGTNNYLSLAEVQVYGDWPLVIH